VLAGVADALRDQTELHLICGRPNYGAFWPALGYTNAVDERGAEETDAALLPVA
jgi:hypothetical protein